MTNKSKKPGLPKLTAEQLAAVPVAKADGFWHHRTPLKGSSRADESTVAVDGEEQAAVSLEDMPSVRSCRCLAVSSCLTLAVYGFVLTVIPLIIILALVLTKRNAEKDQAVQQDNTMPTTSSSSAGSTGLVGAVQGLLGGG